MSAADAAGAGEDDMVAGIPVSDPEVLKATQFILVCVGMSAFFLAIQIVAVAEQQGINGFTAFEVAWSIVGMVSAAALVYTGYYGVKRSNTFFLQCFFFTSLLQCVTAVVEAVWDIQRGISGGMITVQFLEGVFFIFAMYYSRFLWKKSEQANLYNSVRTSDDNSAGYSLLGIQMVLDMKVLKATQRLFTSVAIVASIFSTIVIGGVESAMTDTHARTVWFVCLVFILSLTGSGYYGVKRSDELLLRIFHWLACCLCWCCGTQTALLFMICAMIKLYPGEQADAKADTSPCLSPVFFLFAVTAVLHVAMQSARFLRDKVKSGTVLTQPVSQGVHVGEPTRFGAEMVDVEAVQGTVVGQAPKDTGPGVVL